MADPIVADGVLSNDDILELQQTVRALQLMASDPPFVQLRTVTTDLHNVDMVWEDPPLIVHGDPFVEVDGATVTFTEDVVAQIMVQFDVAPSNTFSGVAGFEINGTILGDLGVDFLNYPYVTTYHFRPSASGLSDFIATTTFPPLQVPAGRTLLVKGVRSILAGSITNNGSVLGIVRSA